MIRLQRRDVVLWVDAADYIGQRTFHAASDDIFYAGSTALSPRCVSWLAGQPDACLQMTLPAQTAS